MRHPRRASQGGASTQSTGPPRSPDVKRRPPEESEPSTHNDHVTSQRKRPAKKSFRPRQEVLARWKDGLLYLGRIVKVDGRGKRCFIKFEDDSEHWALFKNIQKGRSRGEIICVLCHGGESTQPNEIVLCDHCGLGYHQLCHPPHISHLMLKEGIKWYCRQCVFAATAKRGGAVKTGPNARAMQAMKKSLPYKLSDLTWDSHHKTNEEECYCYCSGPGDWYLKMLQCCRCLQWFHEACLQCLDKPLIYGDRFYVFVCSFCNCGPEYLKRLELRWVDVVHLALFSLTIDQNHKYCDFATDIVPWIEGQWDQLQLGQSMCKKCGRIWSCVQLQNTPHQRQAGCIQQTLKSYQLRFQNGSETKKSMNIWALRVRLPPTAPTIELPPNGPITDKVVSYLQLKWPKLKPRSDVEKKSSVSEATSKRRNSCERKTTGKKARCVTDTDLIPNEDEVCVNNSQDYKGYSGNHQCYDVCKNRSDLGKNHSNIGRSRSDVDRNCSAVGRSTSGVCKNRSDVCKNNSDSDACVNSSDACQASAEGSSRKRRKSKATRNTLELRVPVLRSYAGKNHPFRTALECNTAAKCRKKKDQLLRLAQKEDDNSLTVEALLTESKKSSMNGFVSRRKQCGRKSKAAVALAATRGNNGINGVVNLTVCNDRINGLVATNQMHSSIRKYFRPHVTNGRGLEVLASRHTRTGAVQYLVQFDYGLSG